MIIEKGKAGNRDSVAREGSKCPGSPDTTNRRKSVFGSIEIGNGDTGQKATADRFVKKKEYLVCKEDLDSKGNLFGGFIYYMTDVAGGLLFGDYTGYECFLRTCELEFAGRICEGDRLAILASVGQIESKRGKAKFEIVRRSLEKSADEDGRAGEVVIRGFGEYVPVDSSGRPVDVIRDIGPGLNLGRNERKTWEIYDLWVKGLKMGLAGLFPETFGKNGMAGLNGKPITIEGQAGIYMGKTEQFDMNHFGSMHGGAIGAYAEIVSRQLVQKAAKSSTIIRKMKIWYKKPLLPADVFAIKANFQNRDGIDGCKEGGARQTTVNFKVHKTGKENGEEALAAEGSFVIETA